MSKKESHKKEEFKNVESKVMKSDKVALIRPEEANASEAFKKDGKLKRDFYEKELVKLQVELVKLQNWVKEKNKKIIIVFEGRDAAGKGGTIKALTEHLNQRGARVVALGKPSDVEKSQEKKRFF